MTKDGQAMGAPPQIVLDHPGLPYRPGDTIKGLVEVDPSVPFDRILVAAQGRAKVKVSSGSGTDRNTMRSRALVLDMAVEAARDAYGIWRFEVTLPSGAVAPDHKCEFGWDTPFTFGDYFNTKWKDREGFASQGGHPLPPTMHEDTGAYRNYVDYALMARTMRGAEPLGTSARHPFWVTTNCPPEAYTAKLTAEPAAAFIEPIKTLKLQMDPEQAAQGLGLKKGMKSMFGGSKVPEFGWRAIVSFPGFAHVWDSPQFSVAIEPLQPRAGHLAPPFLPEIKLVDFSVDIKHFQNIRAVHHAFDRERAGIVAQTPKDAGHAQYTFKPDPKPASYEQAYAGQVFRFAVPPIEPSTIPTFATYNIVARHQLKIKLKFECVGESRAWECTKPFAVYSRRRNHPGGEVQGFVEGPQDLAEGWGLARAEQED